MRYPHSNVIKGTISVEELILVLISVNWLPLNKIKIKHIYFKFKVVLIMIIGFKMV